MHEKNAYIKKARMKNAHPSAFVEPSPPSNTYFNQLAKDF